MSKVEEVSKYIKSIFDLYGMNDYGFFCDTRDGEPYDVVPVELFKDGEIDGYVLGKVALHTGFSKDELLSLNKNVRTKYLRKFPFFKHLIDYKVALDWDEKYKEAPAERALKNIFRTGEESQDNGMRYDEEDIMRRLVAELQEIDRIIPGTWHDSAELVDVHWYTDSLTGYANCTALLKTFLETVDYYRYLFFKILKKDLKGVEATDFNFLTSALRAVDIVSPVLEINTHTMRNLRRIYNEEGYKDLMSYVRFNVFNEIEPWRCKDFLDDRKLAQGYINYHREGKKAFVEFARTVGKIHCYYSWSDDLENAEVDYDMFGEEVKNYIPEEIYLDKTPEETSGWGDALDRLMAAAASEAKGGLKRPKREYSPYLMPMSMRMEKMLKRRDAAMGIFMDGTVADASIQQIKDIDEKNRQRFPEQYDKNGMRIPLPGEDLGFDLSPLDDRKNDTDKGGAEDE